jgi:hypothetical protein
VPGGGRPPRAGHAPRGRNAAPGFGTPATGAAAARARAAALAKYRGSVERVDKLPDGSYVVHVITPKAEYHVLVSKDYHVTGADQGHGAPGRGGPPPAGNAPRSGTAAPPASGSGAG